MYLIRMCRVNKYVFNIEWIKWETKFRAKTFTFESKRQPTLPASHITKGYTWITGEGEKERERERERDVYMYVHTNF